MSLTDDLFTPGATSRDWVWDGVLAFVMTVGSAVPYLTLVPLDASNRTIALLSALMTLPLVLRRHAPLLMLALCTGAGVLQLVALTQPTWSLFAVPVVSYTVARWVPGGLARSVVVIGAFASVLGPLRWLGPYSDDPAFDVLSWAACMGAVLTPYAVGRRFRELDIARHRQLEAAEERIQLLLAERDQQAKLAEASTRTMIARELHDIVAHSLSVIIVQAEGGRAAATKKPEVAVEALDTIAETGREALHEMRRIVGVLRGGPREKVEYTPAPVLGDIPELVARTSDRATLDVRGDPYAVSPALALTIYRVVQEALTNFLKHAGPAARATVTLVYDPQSITVDITDNGRGTDEPTGGGNGLRGMYERVVAMGGVLLAGPRGDVPGFRVNAVLPVHDAVGADRRG